MIIRLEHYKIDRKEPVHTIVVIRPNTLCFINMIVTKLITLTDWRTFFQPIFLTTALRFFRSVMMLYETLTSLVSNR